MKPLQNISSRIDGKLVAYTTLAGAALAGPAFAPSAEATIVYSGTVNIAIPITVAGIYLNVATGVVAATPGGAPGWDLNPWGTSTFFLYANNAASPMDGVVSNFPGGSSATLTDNLPFGTPINGTFTFGRGNNIETTGPTAFTLNSSNNLAGFRFTNETAGGAIQFGWIRISLSTAYNASPRLVVEYAYENSGAPILAGAVPEPSTFALLGVMAAGALGVRQWRKRKTV
jgi:hypothetical protein